MWKKIIIIRDEREKSREKQEKWERALKLVRLKDLEH
jgi:hypothetical protein